MRPLRICMAIDYYYPVLGGSEIQAYRLVESLSKKGLEISVVTRSQTGLSVSNTYDAGRIYRLPIFGRKRKASIVFLAQVFYFLIRHRSEYDIVHCHLVTSTALGCLMAGLITKKPLLVKLGGSGRTGDVQTSLSTKAGRLKLGLLKKGCCRFVAPSMDIAKEMIEAGFSFERIRVIPNGVDTAYFPPISPAEKRAKKQELGLDRLNLALYIGRLEHSKDIPLLIDAWSQLREKVKDWRLWIIGSGSLENAVRSRIQKKGMDNKISLMPHILPDKVRDYLQIGDLFVHASRSEGLSNSILEAMSCALPVIASRIMSNQDLIKDGFNGLLFDVGDLSDLTRTIQRAMEDERKREQWGINARGRVIEDLDISHVAVQYMKLYHRILAGTV